MRFRRRHRHLLPPLHYYRHLRRNETGRMLQVRANLILPLSSSFSSSLLLCITSHTECIRNALLQVFDVWRRFPVRLFSAGGGDGDGEGKAVDEEETNKSTRKTQKKTERKKKSKTGTNVIGSICFSLGFLLLFLCVQLTSAGVRCHSSSRSTAAIRTTAAACTGSTTILR